jgi:hypothetical protein
MKGLSKKNIWTASCFKPANGATYDAAWMPLFSSVY